MPNRNAGLMTATAYATVMRCLMDGATLAEMVEESGLYFNTIAKLLRVMHRQHTVHISAWEPDTIGRQTVRVWKFGEKVDAKKPRKTMKQRNAEQYAKKQQIALLTGSRIKDVQITGYRVSTMGTLEAAA